MSLRRPLAGPEMSRSGIRNHSQINGRDGSAKAGIWHVARHTRLISKRRHVLVEIHKFAERFYQLGSVVQQGWRLTSQSRRRDGVPARECPAFDEIHLTQDPLQL